MDYKSLFQYYLTVYIAKRTSSGSDKIKHPETLAELHTFAIATHHAINAQEPLNIESLERAIRQSV